MTTTLTGEVYTTLHLIQYTGSSYRSSYFQGRQVHGDWDIRVEQAEFKDITVSATTQAGVVVTISEDRSRGRVARWGLFVVYSWGNLTTFVVRNFKPDFLLIRQNLKDATEDYKNVLLGFQYGGIPSINSLKSIYNFQVHFMLIGINHIVLYV